MKNHLLVKKIFQGFLCLSLFITSLSCTKDFGGEKFGDEIEQGETVALSLSAFAEDFVDYEASSTLASVNNINDKTYIKEGYGSLLGVDNGEDYDVAMYVQNSSSGSNKLRSLGKIASQTLGQNIKYRVYIRNRSTGLWQTKVFSSQSTSGSDTIVIRKNFDYDWYAISNNTSNESDVPSTLNSQKTSIGTFESSNKDLLWAKGELLKASLTGNKRLNIVFKHMLARFHVHVDFRGIFLDKIYSGTNVSSGENTSYLPTIVSLDASGNSTFVSKGKLNIVSGLFESHETLYTTPASYLETRDKRNYYTYSSVPRVIKRVNVKFDNLNFTKLGGDPNMYSYATRTISFVAPGSSTDLFRSQLGASTRVNFLLIEAPYRSGSVVTKWAKANLFYNEAVSSDGRIQNYMFRQQSVPGVNASSVLDPAIAGTYYKYNSLGFDMWKFNTLKPEGTEVGDPCGQVYPLGAWRMPTNSEFSSFATSIPVTNRSNYFPGNDAVIGVLNSGNPTTPQSKSRYLVFERLGRVVSTSPGVVSDQTEGYYWTSNSDFLFSISGTGTSGVVQTIPKTTETHASIRCVRTNLYAN